MNTTKQARQRTAERRPVAPNAWPSRSTLTIRDGRERLLQQSSDRHFDLADRLMMSWPRASRTVYLGLSTKSASWTFWTEDALREIERHIRYDLGFDGYGVTLMRLTPQGRRAQPCSVEFCWRLRVRNR